MTEVQTRLTSDRADLELLAPMLAWAFGGGVSGALQRLEEVGPGVVRVVSARGGIGGGLLEVPMGQWFGGRRVPLLGIAGVVIAPEARGGGVALGLMRSTLRAARERGFCLSVLYPSTYALYRKAGYELAGSHCRFSLSLRQLPRVARPLAVDNLGEGASADVEALYTEVARHRTGYLDRGPYVWARVRNPEREPARGFAVMGPRGLDGYAYVKAASPQRVPFELIVSDWVARSPDAFQTLLGFLADHSTTAERARFYGGPADARLLGLPERVVNVAVEEYWMLRVVDVRGALLARGYPALDAAIDLEIEDPLLPENSACHGLRVEGGVARIEDRGAQVSAQLSVSALAALYTGFLSPRELMVAGQLSADERGLAVLSSLFAGPAPGLADFF